MNTKGLEYALCHAVLYALIAICQVHGFGYLCEPEPRQITAEYMNQLPPPMQSLSPEFIKKIPVGYIRRKYGREYGIKYRHVDGLPCGGVPSGNRAERCIPGKSLKMGWKIETPSATTCKVTLMCPESSVQKVLWIGSCGSGQISQNVNVPHDVEPCEQGKCFLQWSMVTAEQDQYVNCVDVVVEKPQAISSSLDLITTFVLNVPTSKEIQRTCVPSTKTITVTGTTTATVTAYSTLYSPVYSTVYSTEYSPVYSTVYSTEYSPVYSTVHSTEYSTVYSPIYSTEYSTMFSTEYSPVYSTIYSTKYSPVYSTVTRACIPTTIIDVSTAFATVTATMSSVQAETGGLESEQSVAISTPNTVMPTQMPVPEAAHDVESLIETCTDSTIAEAERAVYETCTTALVIPTTTCLE